MVLRWQVLAQALVVAPHGFAWWFRSASLGGSARLRLCGAAEAAVATCVLPDRAAR